MDVRLTVAAPELQKSTERRDIVTYCERWSSENDGPSRNTKLWQKIFRYTCCIRKFPITLSRLNSEALPKNYRCSLNATVASGGK